MTCSTDVRPTGFVKSPGSDGSDSPGNTATLSTVRGFIVRKRLGPRKEGNDSRYEVLWPGLVTTMTPAWSYPGMGRLFREGLALNRLSCGAVGQKAAVRATPPQLGKECARREVSLPIGRSL